MRTLYQSACGAVRPWFSIDAEKPMSYLSPSCYDALPQRDIEICLSCPRCAADCEHCDGRRIVSQSVGRRRKEIDRALLREMVITKRRNREICAALGIGKTRLLEEKRLLKEEGI